MSLCSVCGGKGLVGGCPGCGETAYTNDVTEDLLSSDGYIIPTYYRMNQWDSQKVRYGSNEVTNDCLQLLDKIVTQVSKGGPIKTSYAFLLPDGLGKKTAMFTIIQHYRKYGKVVAPVIDIASLAIIENNFKVNDKEAVELWRQLISADLVCVYGVDFSARYLTMKLFLNLCSIRGLQDKNTLLFDSNPLHRLRSQFHQDNITPDNNVSDVGCRLSHPFIIDGIPREG